MESQILIIFLSFALLLLLMALGVHIAVAMGIIGFMGFWYFSSLKSALVALETIPYAITTNFLLVAIPLFILMGTLALHSGITTDLYDSLAKWVGHFKGGLGMATIIACAGFGAVSGSSTAAAATMASICLPEMRRLGYDRRFAAGCVAAGGTLSIMIPPSLTFIIFGWLTGASIGKLFIAGILPGILSSIMFIIALRVIPFFVPNAYPSIAAASWSDRLRSSKGIIPILLIALLVLGGLYGGLFTPTEAAAVGVAGVFIIGLLRRRVNAFRFRDSIYQAVITLAMMFAIMVGAMIFGHYLSLNKFPELLSNLVLGIGISRPLLILGIVIIYLILGCFLDVMAMQLLTIPVIFPLVVNAGFDPIWFGVLVCKLSEFAFITPPVGMNVYLVAGVARDIPLDQIFLGILPFFFAECITLTLLILFPQISLFLPGTMV